MLLTITGKELASAEATEALLAALAAVKEPFELFIDLIDLYPREYYKDLFFWYKLPDLNPSVLPNIQRIIAAVPGRFNITALTIQIPENNQIVTGLPALIAVTGSLYSLFQGDWRSVLLSVPLLGIITASVRSEGLITNATKTIEQVLNGYLNEYREMLAICGVETLAIIQPDSFRTQVRQDYIYPDVELNDEERNRIFKKLQEHCLALGRPLAKESAKQMVRQQDEIISPVSVASLDSDIVLVEHQRQVTFEERSAQAVVAPVSTVLSDLLNVSGPC